jgi:hypothetical protein
MEVHPLGFKNLIGFQLRSDIIDIHANLTKKAMAMPSSQDNVGSFKKK